MNSLILATLLLTTPADEDQLPTPPLKCMLLNSRDNFWFYKEQLVYESEQFALFHNFKGRVVTQIDLKSGEWIRTTYIGEPYDPKYQILLGYCNNPIETLKKWKRSETIYDN
ncbi:hypothetical protein [Vibrio sonorensis]|uniref:hypothetical protein n=1 Tax=Vibrio sonorensis TaxID=1004316 RepID=UPI0008DB026D|nr:hypothetical protein [Vibrio sonorensis]